MTRWNPCGERIAIRFDTGEEVDAAVTFIYKHPELNRLPFDSPDGYELHIPAEAEAIFKQSGLRYKSFRL